MGVYVDTSAAAALLVHHDHSARLKEWLTTQDLTSRSSDLLELEMRHFAIRLDIDQQNVNDVLDGVTLHEMDRSVYHNAALLPMQFLRSLDALHLQTAIRLKIAAVLTYNHRFQDAASTVGLEVFSPGAMQPNSG